MIEKTKGASLLFLTGWHYWISSSEVVRNATIQEAIDNHARWENLYLQIGPNYEYNTCYERICYHRQQIGILQAFSGQAGKKTRR